MKKKFLPLLLVGVSVIIFPFLFSQPVHADEDSPSTVTFCLKHNGSVYTAGRGQKKSFCRDDDRYISFKLSILDNLGTVGPQGPIGPAGSQGVQGIQGEQGIQGIPGTGSGDSIPGPKGDQGIQGIQGEVGPKGDTGLQGIQGPVGPAGQDGTSGSGSGISGWEKVMAATTSAGTDQTFSATCTSGKKVIGGGYATSNAVTYLTYYALENYPSTDNSWTATVHRANSGGATWTLNVYALCVSGL